MAYCENCKSTTAIRVRTQYFFNKNNGLLNKTEQCDQCTSIADQTPRDAMGNKVVGYPDGYSYATDAVHTSKRGFAEHLKAHDLIQKDGNTGGKKRWK